MTTLYHDWISGDCIPSFLPRSYLYRAEEGRLAGRTVQFAGGDNRTEGFILVSTLTTGAFERVSNEMTELMKYKRVARKDLTSEEQKALDIRAKSYMEMGITSPHGAVQDSGRRAEPERP